MSREQMRIREMSATWRCDALRMGDARIAHQVAMMQALAYQLPIEEDVQESDIPKENPGRPKLMLVYSRGNPVNRIDPTGLDDVDVASVDTGELSESIGNAKEAMLESQVARGAACGDDTLCRVKEGIGYVITDVYMPDSTVDVGVSIGLTAVTAGAGGVIYRTGKRFLQRAGGWVKGLFKGKADEAVEAVVRSAELRPYGGPGGGHHVPAKVAFEGAPNYDLKEALAIPNAELKRLNIYHPDVTAGQMVGYREFAKSGGALAWDDVARIETNALVRGADAGDGFYNCPAGHKGASKRRCERSYTHSVGRKMRHVEF